MDATDRGFSLLEVLVATTLLTVALSSLAQLLLFASRANAGARATTQAVVLAQDKMEQLRGMDISELAVSPPGALVANVAGYVDYVDTFVRRWSVEPLPGNPGNTIVIQVLVTRAMTRGEARLVSVKTRKAG